MLFYLDLLFCSIKTGAKQSQIHNKSYWIVINQPKYLKSHRLKLEVSLFIWDPLTVVALLTHP